MNKQTQKETTSRLAAMLALSILGTGCDNTAELEMRRDETPESRELSREAKAASTSDDLEERSAIVDLDDLSQPAPKETDEIEQIGATNVERFSFTEAPTELDEMEDDDPAEEDELSRYPIPPKLKTIPYPSKGMQCKSSSVLGWGQGFSARDAKNEARRKWIGNCRAAFGSQWCKVAVEPRFEFNKKPSVLRWKRCLFFARPCKRT